MSKFFYKDAPKVKTIFMDLGGVVLDIDAELSITAYEKMGVSNIREFLNSYKQEGPFLALDKGLIGHDEFIAEMRKTFPSLKDRSADEISEAHMAIHIAVPKNKLDIIFELKKHFRIFATSNISEDGWKWCKDNGFDLYGRSPSDYFDGLCLSCRTHSIKPDAEFFRKALDMASSLPQDTLLIDDSQKNCESAASLGIRTYNPKTGEDWSHIFEGI